MYRLFMHAMHNYVHAVAVQYAKKVIQMKIFSTGIWRV